MFVPAVVLIACGALLLLAEIMLLPGFTLPGILGSLLILLGVVWAGWRDQSMLTGGIYAAITAGITVPIGLFGLWLTPRTRAGRRFILQTVERSDEGYRAPSSALEALVGQHGKALTPLRPSGTALIDKKQVDVVTQGTFILQGTEIQVVMVEGNRVVVSNKEE